MIKVSKFNMPPHASILPQATWQAADHAQRLNVWLGSGSHSLRWACHVSGMDCGNEVLWSKPLWYLPIMNQ
jgi:hypothetical protein